MTDTLVGALEKVHLSAESADYEIDQILDQRLPRKRTKQDNEALKHELEQKYLTPSNTFSTEWLNKLQQYAVCKNWCDCTLLIIFTDAGMPHQTSLLSSRLPRHRPEP